MVGATPGQINLPQLYSHTGVVLHGGVSELVASCACQSFRSVAIAFMDGVGKAAAATPSDEFFLLLCPCYCGVVSDALLEHREELFRSTCRRWSALVTAGRWCTLCLVCGWRLMILVLYSAVVVRGCQC